MWEVQLSHCLFTDFISYSTNENKTLFPLNWRQSSIVRKFIALWGSSDLCPVQNNHTYIFHLCYKFDFQWKWGGESRNNHWCISHLPLNNQLLWHTDKKHGLDSYSSHYLLLHTGRSHEPEACLTLLVPQRHSKSKRYQSLCVAKLSDHNFNLQCWTLTQLNPGCPKPGLNPAWPGPPHIHTCPQLIHSESFRGKKNVLSMLRQQITK